MFVFKNLHADAVSEDDLTDNDEAVIESDDDESTTAVNTSVPERPDEWSVSGLSVEVQHDLRHHPQEIYYDPSITVYKENEFFDTVSAPPMFPLSWFHPCSPPFH